MAHVQFDEGLAVGNRFFEAYGQKPLFPFSYGLTNASLQSGKPSVQVSRDGTVTVTVPVGNRSELTDEAVVQALLSGSGWGTGQEAHGLR